MGQKAEGSKKKLLSQGADSKLAGQDNPAVDNKNDDDGDHTRDRGSDTSTGPHENGTRRKGLVTITEEGLKNTSNGNGTADHNGSSPNGLENGRRKGVVRDKYPATKSPPKSPPVETPSYNHYVYPDVCAFCHTLWDHKGDTDLRVLCKCKDSKLHVHRSCLEVWMKRDGRIRCQQCRSLYKYRGDDPQRMVQRLDMCIIVVLIPVGVVTTVCACLLWDAARYAREEAEATGSAYLKLGLPVEQFAGVFIVMGAVLIAAYFATKIILCGTDHSTKEEEGEGRGQKVVEKV